MAEPSSKSPRLVLKRGPRGPWWVRLLKVLAVLGLTGLTLAFAAVAVLYCVFSHGLPDIPSVDSYRPPVLSQVFTDDDVLAGEFYYERRKVIPYDHVPKRLVQAFIASEDADFFEHHGIDFSGTARAAFKTIFHKLTGRGHIQGGSTLTQQTAKALLISQEGFEKATARTLKRKIREAILARRLEKALTKEQILYLYLNNVYLGNHAYGVESAAENYFRKDVRELTLAQMALIAGLPQAPSGYSPLRHPKRARRRRHYVLGRMLADGMISKAEHDRADAEPIHVHAPEDVFHEFAPYFVEQVRRDVVQRYGDDRLLKDGLRIFTTMDSERQRAAQDAMLDGLLEVDKRQGYRGPVKHLATRKQRDAFIQKSIEAMDGEKLTQGHYYVGLVTEIAKDGLSAKVQVGAQTGVLPLLGMRWARPLNPEKDYRYDLLDTITGTLKVGDVIVVRSVDEKHLWQDHFQFDAGLLAKVPKDVPLFRLEQLPELQGALVSIEPHQQYLTAMVGGYDFDANEYNRAFQACRQPGSGWKPLTYSAAIQELGWTEATIIVDSPVVFDDPENKVRWKPQNYEGSFKGDVLLRTALIDSMNIPAVKTFAAVGIHHMAAWAKRLGLTTPMNMDLSAALGSSCVYPYELAQVYATFDRLGLKRPTYYIRKIEDRFGRMVEDHTSYDDPWAPLADRVAGGYARLFEPGTRVMKKTTAFITDDIMRGVVTEGTGQRAMALGKPAAGKTGTTNDSFDAWFNGFTQDLETTTWVGYDLNPHPLGRYETGSSAALPIWLAYMKRALGSRPQAPFDPPPSIASRMVRLNIDLKTGRIAPPDDTHADEMWFLKGTEPKAQEPPKGQVDPTQVLQLP